MTTKKHTVFELAARQLQMAVILFIHNQDKFSSITLAGAADVLLAQLVRKQGLRSFTQIIQDESGDDEEKQMSLGDFGKKINDMLSINAVKHFDTDDSSTVLMDVDECALTAIMKALPNFCSLGGRNYKFVNEFLAWAKCNLDPEIYNTDAL